MPPQLVMQPKALSREPIDSGRTEPQIPEFLLGQYPAAYGLLGGGRNSLLESAQEATLMSVPTSTLSVNGTKPAAEWISASIQRDFRLIAHVSGKTQQHVRDEQHRYPHTEFRIAGKCRSSLRAGSGVIASILFAAEPAHMDHLWSPWRFTYVTTADSAARPGVPESLAAWPGNLGCVFCNLIASIDYAVANGMDSDCAEAAGGLVLRGKTCFICLNAYPYTSGHVMVMPYAHLDRLAKLPRETAHELIDLAQHTERALNSVYSPHGFNFGLNVGRAAGAGVAEHLHLHAMPRWAGDTNFMTTVGETRVLPEDLVSTWKRLREGLKQSE